MVEKIEVKISNPSGIYKTLSSKKVQIPAFEGDITLLTHRAPSIFKLSFGLVKTLDDNSKPVEMVFVDEGFAEYSNGICNIMVENTISYNEISITQATSLSEETKDLSTKKFYSFIADYLSKEIK